jgi:crotonobetainyl-CoA:carnitine CoA-transferase CaiB-like acyl-CoA transferase
VGAPRSRTGGTDASRPGEPADGEVSRPGEPADGEVSRSGEPADGEVSRSGEPAVAGPLSGVRAVEVASHVFVPMAGSVLTEWGADVIKIEHPVTGDPYRGLATVGLHNDHHGIDPFFQSANRGKRSVAVDLTRPRGRALLARIVGQADVFLTSLRAEARRRLRIDVDDVRADNPDLVVVRATAFGQLGPDAGDGGYDVNSYWARSGMQHALTPASAPWPVSSRPAFGDVVGGLTIAGAVSAALYRRATTGRPSVIDASLLASGIWQVQPDVTNARLEGGGATETPDRYEWWNPLTLPYRTADDRFVALIMVAGDARWPELCTAIGHPEAVDDPRWIDLEARRRNARSCIEWLESVFAERTLDDWRQALAGIEGEWSAVQTPGEVHDDPQVRANRYIADVDMANGITIPLVTSPVQFDGEPGRPRRGPEHGEHTEAVLLELGLTWAQIGALKTDQAIL